MTPPPIVRSAPAVPSAGAELGVLRVPSLGLTVRLAQGGADLTTTAFPPLLDDHVAHYPTTALPWQRGTVLVSGHRTTYLHPFLHIDRLRRGQAIMLRVRRAGSAVLGRSRWLRAPAPGLRVSWRAVVYRYRVVAMRIVRPTDLSFASWNSGHEIALAACHPPGSARRRIVVIGALAGERMEP